MVVHSDIWGWCQLIGCCILSSWICVGCWRGRSECAGRLVGKELMKWEFMYLRVMEVAGSRRCVDGRRCQGVIAYPLKVDS